MIASSRSAFVVCSPAIAAAAIAGVQSSAIISLRAGRLRRLSRERKRALTFVERERASMQPPSQRSARFAVETRWRKTRVASVESSFLLRQRFTPHQLSRDNRPIVLLLFLMLLHTKDIWRNIHVFQPGRVVERPALIWIGSSQGLYNFNLGKETIR